MTNLTPENPEYWDTAKLHGVDPRTPYGIRHDKWDVEDYEQAIGDVKKLIPARDSLRQITETAPEQMADAFWTFMKVTPEEEELAKVKDTFRVNRTVDTQLLKLPETAELRRFTRGDIVGSAMATVKMEPTLEVLHDRERTRQEEANKLQKEREKLMDLQREQKRREIIKVDGPPPDGPPGDEPDDGEGPIYVYSEPPQGENGEPNGQPTPIKASDLSDEELQEMIEDLQRQVNAQEQALKEKLENDEIDIEATLKSVMRDVVDEARAESMAFMAFGIEPGVLQRLPADVRLKYASKFNQPRIKKIAEQFGKMKNIAFSPKMKWVDDVPHEFKSVRLGDSITQALSYELARFDDEELELSFLADWAEGKLIEKQMHGKRKVGRGGIILCEDGSGSMHGEPEIMAKSVMLCLGNIARMEHREFHLVHFGSPGQFRTISFPRPEDWTLDRVIEAAELFFGGGTDFVTPLDEAMRICKEEHARTGAVKSDIIFVTDGQCHVSDAWLAKFREDVERLDITVWGCSVGGRKTDQPLNNICGGNVCTVYDLHNPGSDIKDVFASL